MVLKKFLLWKPLKISSEAATAIEYSISDACQIIKFTTGCETSSTLLYSEDYIKVVQNERQQTYSLGKDRQNSRILCYGCQVLQKKTSVQPFPKRRPELVFLLRFHAMILEAGL